MKLNLRFSPIKTILLFFVCLASVQNNLAQESRTVEWLTTLQAIEAKLPTANQNGNERQQIQNQLTALKEQVKAWIISHPEIKLENGAALLESAANNQGASSDNISAQTSQLRRIVEEISQKDPANPFSLGRVEVTVNAELPTAVANGTVQTVDQAEIQRYNRKTVTDALNLVPGVLLSRIGQRNERVVFVRGFDVDQVPVLIDGIPVYVPYDGYLDLDRFTTFDLSEVRVSKGFSSPLYGANTIGGAINLVSRRPTRKLEGSLGAGAASGDTYDAFLNLGTSLNKFYFQGGGSILQSQTFPLSEDFRPTRFEPSDENRTNAYRRDHKLNFKAGYAPNARSEYSFTYVNQRSKKGNPPYAGQDSIVRPRYWRWDYWDKESFYFISNTDLNSTSYLRFRGFYDKFDNLLNSYDDARFTTQTRPYAFRSFYDDDTYGGSVEFGTSYFERQQIKAAFHYKRDEHKENNAGEPVRLYKDQIVSFGVEDTIQVFDKLNIVAGFSVDHLDITRADRFERNIISPFATEGETAFNPQIGLFYTPFENGRLRFTFARKSRLPTIKDRYSYRLGQAIPNPELQAERANNFEVGYSQSFSKFGTSHFGEISVFYSDISDLVQAFFISPTLFQLRNIDKARHAGVEISLRSAFNKWLDSQINYTYLDRENKSIPKTVLVGTPRHKLFAALGYTPINKLRLQAVAQLEAGRFDFGDGGRLRRVDQFTVVDVQSTYQFPKGIEVQAGISNLFDRNYQYDEGYPEAGRSFFLNLRYRF